MRGVYTKYVRPNRETPKLIHTNRIKSTTRLLIMLILSLVWLLALFTSINLAQSNNWPLHPPRNSHTAPPTTTISITFESLISATTVNSRTFAIHAMQSGLLTKTHGVMGATLIVTPSQPFHQGELVYAIATTGTLTISGTELPAPTQWQFRAGQVISRCVGGFDEIDAGLAGVNNSSVAWGDYDNDGDLDILLTGYSDLGSIARIYRNDGPELGFYDAEAGLTGVRDGAAVWGDYDNDGDLDILLIGQSSAGRVTQVYRNDPSSGSERSFTDIEAGLPGFYWGSAAWGDYDNDGDLDILLTGYSDLARRTTKLYRNNGPANPGLGWNFDEVNAGLKGTRWGEAIWGDYDNDGDLDILLTGYSGGGKDATLIYSNDGPAAGWTFTDIDAGLLNVEASATAWGDYDNDGDLDILLTGFVLTDSIFVSRLYRNNGSVSGWSFSPVEAGLPDVAYGAVAWGDYDNDGRLDILFTGEDSDETLLTRIYHNDGPTAGWSFSDIDAGLTDVAYSDVAWGDYDDDGDLDILLTGYNLISRIYRNSDCAADLALVNTAILPPAVPKGAARAAMAAPNDAITYTLNFTNIGSLTATHIIITDVMPITQFNFVTYTAGSGITHVDTPLDQPYVWQAAALPPDTGGAITITGVLDADLKEGHVVTNTASITTATPDENPVNNTSSAIITVDALPDNHIYLAMLMRGRMDSNRQLTSSNDEVVIQVTPTEIDTAIADGITWLAAAQQGNGSWADNTADTCFALSVLQQHAYDLDFDAWDNPGYTYRDHIIQGWQYVFTTTRTVKYITMTVQAAGNPDSNGNGYGVSFQYDGRHHVYAGGVCMAALEASRTPDRENDGGLNYDGDGTPDTFLELAQEAVDWMALAQLDGGQGQGNWFYTVEDNESINPDQSNGGFAVLGLAAAERMGAVVPSFVRSELNHAIDYIQCSTPGASYGGAGYSSPCSYVNEYKTGLLILQMGFYGDHPNSGRFQDALNYMEQHWQDSDANPGWGYNLNPAGYLAMLSLQKGLRYNGLNLLDTDGDGARDDDWYRQEPPASPAQDLATVLVSQQEAGGNWPFCDWGNDTLCTSWALLTLQKASFAPPDQPDALIRVEPEVGFTGNDIYNPDGAAQTSNANPNTGETVTYTVRIENDGSLTATYTITGSSGDGVWNVAYQDATNADITSHITGAGWSTGDLLPGEAISITVHVMAGAMPDDSPAYAVLVAVVSGGAPSRIDAVRADVAVNGYYYRDLGLNLAGNNAFSAPGEAISHTLTFSNSGNITAAGIVITSVLTLQTLDDVTYTVSGGLAITGALVSPFVWQLTELAPGAGGIITISGVLSANLPNGYVITHTASITGAAPDINPANNKKSVTITVAPPGRIYLPLIMRTNTKQNIQMQSPRRGRP